MPELLDTVILEPEQENLITSERAKKYAKLSVLELEIMREKEELEEQLTVEEKKSVETALKESQQYFSIPQYFSVREVAMLTGLSPQVIRRHCANKKFNAFQATGQNGTWYIESEQFRDHPEWNTFIQKRNNLFIRSKRVAEAAQKLWDETE